MTTTAETIVTGYVANLITSATTRLTSAISVPLKRRRKINNALDSKRPNSVSDEVVDTAIKDLEIVIGSYRGMLTTDMAAFISALARSGIPSAILQSIVLRSDAHAIQQAFRLLYKDYLQDDDTGSDRLYNALHTALGSVLESRAKDISLYIAAINNAGYVGSNLEKINAALETFIKQSNKLAIDEINDIILKIAKQSQGIFKNIKIETKRGSREVDITKIYVPSRLTNLRNDDKSITDSTSEVNLSYEEIAKNKQISYQSFRRSFSRAVILGDPGGGKSTLCQQYCSDLARQMVLGIQFPSAERIEIAIQKLPLRIVLRSFEKARNIDPQLDLFTFMIRDLLNMPGFDEVTLRQAVMHYLSLGQAAICFDGLDEILNISRRREYVEVIRLFADAYPLCPILVTSRQVGYQDAPLPNSFVEYQLSPFDNQEVEGYVAKFLKVCGYEKKQNAEERAKIFMEQTSHHASDLRSNPLMLGLMSWLFMNYETVPKNRPEIYSECALLMFEKWDKNRGIQADIPSDFKLLGLFSYVASHVYGNAETEDGVSDEWLERKLNAFFQEWYEEKAKARAASKALLEFIVGRAWVMSEIGPKVFKFTHRTFLEYFFARYLDDQNETVDSLMRSLMTRILSGQQDVVCHLALQIKTYNKQNRIAQVVKYLTSCLNESRIRAEQLARMVTFTAASLEYLPSTEPQHRTLIRAVSGAALRSVVNGKFSIGHVISECLRHAPERQKLVGSEILATFKDTYFSGDGEAQEAVLWVLSDEEARRSFVYRSGNRFGSIFAYNSAFRFNIQQSSGAQWLLPQGLISSSRRICSKDLLERSNHDIFAARIAIEWGVLSPCSGFERYGIGVFFATGNLRGGAFNHGVLARMVSFALWSERRDDAHLHANREDCLSLMEILSNNVKERRSFDFKFLGNIDVSDLIGYAITHRHVLRTRNHTILQNAALIVTCVYYEVMIGHLASRKRTSMPSYLRTRPMFWNEVFVGTMIPKNGKQEIKGPTDWFREWVDGDYDLLKIID